MKVVSTRVEPLPEETEARFADFTDLVATAIANTQARADLAASRARVVAAGDEARRRIERDLHDGTQQRLVSLTLDLRTAEASVPTTDLTELQAQLSTIANELTGAQDDLREISRGIHPAILSEGGLGPALKSLTRRAALPGLAVRRADHAGRGDLSSPSRCAVAPSGCAARKEPSTGPKACTPGHHLTP
jgi:signal transduction histidine kinase